ncbi:MAG TPA: arginase family protein [Vicinamibacterales bacterium]|nr:arginase family protein [Vicinamibacterales bacterium]
MKPSAPLVFVHPEWQGFGLHADVRAGALRLADAIARGRDRFSIEVPEHEPLDVDAGVLGLQSIARAAEHACRGLRERAPARILTIGGTCGTELGPVAYLNARYAGDLAVIWFDAHADLNTPASSPSGHFHGMILRTLTGDGPPALTRLVERRLDPRQIFLAGTRDLDPPEAEFVAAASIDLTPPDSLTRPEALAARIRAAGYSRVYLHVDVDVFDPAAFADTLMPVPGGATPDVVLAAVAAIAHDLDVVGCSLVEFCDRSEGRGIGALAAIAAAAFPASAGATSV